jgi:hypothetical protein
MVAIRLVLTHPISGSAISTVAAPAEWPINRRVCGLAAEMAPLFPIVRVLINRPDLVARAAQRAPGIAWYARLTANAHAITVSVRAGRYALREGRC